ncbi:hypothetical protein Prudu_012240 [Prunus dulcis]|uniref:Terpene synthase metal-binding domain-containing protein n=1 Tax=Prunus dulcis TaxID=3755 RepID=A0A4Y1RC79_PRUDU|nr:hypothetical protein Prudu_012240 [Prunus dulcis]
MNVGYICHGTSAVVHEKRLINRGNLHRIHYAREAIYYMAGLVCQMKVQKYTPAMDEYMSAALDTSYFPLATISFIGMRDIVTKDSMDWVFSDPKIEKAASVIGRLMDDMKSHKDATEEEATIELSNQVSNAWKDINEICLRPTIFPMPLLLRILNLARAIEVIYKRDDSFTHAGIFLKDSVVSLFVEPVSL